MANGDPLPDDEVVIRRFNPEVELHCTHDDADGPALLKGNALYFKADDIGIACSIYQHSLLEPNNLTPSDLIETEVEERAGYRLASIRVGLARSVKYLRGDNPLTYIEDRFPDGNPPPHPRDAAHASILVPEKVAGLSRLLRDVAVLFDVLPVTA